MIQYSPSEPPSAAPPGGWPTRIGVTRRDDGHHAIALEAVRASEVLLEVDGVFVDQPDRYSLQVDTTLHIVPPPSVSRDDDAERYRWRYLNHSCRPNAMFRGRLLVAVAPIGRGEEVTFDYNTTELEIACPFACRCGHCGGRVIRGFRHLSPAEQRRREPFLAGHLRALLDKR